MQPLKLLSKLAETPIE